MTYDELKKRIDAVEESYEFFLAYAAQGLARDDAAQAGSQLRGFLERMDQALSGLADDLLALVNREPFQPVDAHASLVEVLRRDADSTLAAVRVVRSLPAISSQTIDNLNASIHVRALLTDLFLIDEVLVGMGMGAEVQNRRSG